MTDHELSDWWKCHLCGGTNIPTAKSCYRCKVQRTETKVESVDLTTPVRASDIAAQVDEAEAIRLAAKRAVGRRQARRETMERLELIGESANPDLAARLERSTAKVRQESFERARLAREVVRRKLSS